MAKLYIPVGIPGCGKSTLAEIFCPHYTQHIVSTDQIRERMVVTGDLESVNDMSRNNEVFERYHNDIEFYLHRCDNVFADATNLRDFARKELREISERYNVETHVIVFNNLLEAIERNKNRDRVVPTDVINKMLEYFEVALRDIPQEGYTSITYIESMS